MESSIGTVPQQQAIDLLRRIFGYSEFRGAQAEIVDHVSNGGDALVLMPTGAGKSLCYQIPALLRRGVGVVVSPLIALMQDQVDALAELGVRAAFLNSTLSGVEAASVERQVRAGELDLLYVAPERLLSERCLNLLEQSRVALFAIDEAHCVAQWGHDFRPEYIQLSILHERFPDVPRIALTATADAQTRAEIVERLQLHGARVYVSSFDRPNIRYQIVEKLNARKQLLDFIRAEHDGECGIVYCLSRKKVEETAAFLMENGIDALPYHAGMDSITRQKHQARFLRADGLVMVATIAFGMGIDKPDVRFVAHLDLPKSIEGYYQETGRAGRDGMPADAWMTYGLQDVVQLRRMIAESEADETFKRVSSVKLDAMLGLCESADCRRKRLLNYFDESTASDYRCGYCDTCLSPPASFDATVAVQKLLSCIYRTGQRFGAVHVMAVLRGDVGGQSGERIKQWQHDQLSVFGVGHEYSETEWRALIRQCLALGVIDVDHDAYGAIKLTDDSRAVLKGERKVMLRELRKPVRTVKSSRKTFDSELNSVQQRCFDSLRDWRLGAARQHNVPAYVIFHDGTLREIALRQPDSLEALQAISGIGAKKLEAYGLELLKVIQVSETI